MMASRFKEPFERNPVLSFVYKDKFYVCTYFRFSAKVYKKGHFFPLRQFSFSTAQWSNEILVNAESEEAEMRCWRELRSCRVACCAVVGDCAYIFGELSRENGWAMLELNLESMVWRALEFKNREDGPTYTYCAEMVTCGDDSLCIINATGAGSRSTEANELHLLHTKTGTWNSPNVTGSQPRFVGFSFTKVDVYRVVLFGGLWRSCTKQMSKHPNEVHILDMKNWNWSGAILPSSPAELWPQGRWSHRACVLFEPTQFADSEGFSRDIPHSPSSDSSAGQYKPQLFVLWGFGEDRDGWILDVDNVTWKRVNLPPAVGPCRISFHLGCYNRSPTEAELVMFGGTLEIPRYNLRLAFGSRPTTTLLYLGVKSLYHSCVDYVAERFELYQPLLQQLLPLHIQTEICQEKDKRANRAPCRVAWL